MTIDEVHLAAKQLAETNAESEPAMQEILFFPDLEELRIIEVDSTASPSELIEPFYFQADPDYGIPLPLAIALIRPEERESLTPPEEWGTWHDAVRIWPEG